MGFVVNGFRLSGGDTTVLVCCSYYESVGVVRFTQSRFTLLYHVISLMRALETARSARTLDLRVHYK